ncbi:MAG: DUF2200 family protein [Limnohabitans sp.]|nr:DUF2200 family protein [Limnohabitans sp.]
MKFGKTIKIFLIDGEPNGRMSCELSNNNPHYVTKIERKGRTKEELHQVIKWLLITRTM